MNKNEDYIIFETNCSEDVAEKAMRDMHNTFRKNHPEYTDEDIAKMSKMVDEMPKSAPYYQVETSL